MTCLNAKDLPPALRRQIERQAPSTATTQYVSEAAADPEIRARLAEAAQIVEEHGSFPDAMTRDEFRAMSSIGSSERPSDRTPERHAVPPRGKRGTNRWTCGTCHETFTAWSRAEKHSDEYQHHRIELDVTREER